MSDPSKKMYAWVSPTAIMQQDLIVTYQTNSGDNVIISSITDNPHNSGLMFTDVTFIGEVDRWISSIPNPHSKTFT